MSDPYQPTEAAALLGVSRSTLLRYTDTFELFLPDYAERSAGVQRRRYTHQDLCWLSAIIDLHRQQPKGTSREALREMIESPDFAPLVIPTRLPNEETEDEKSQEDPPTIEQGEQPAPQLPATVQRAAPDTSQLPALVVDMLNQQIRDVRDENAETRRMVEELKSRETSRGSALAYGVILGIGLAIVFAAVLSLMFG